uniref:Homeobox domain-containing protein n=1 Tax=Denticeps clupeoides TaxID=299321 RepID=A0AAY4AWH2_9TELE
MKGHFSIEWLSQSTPSNSWPPVGPNMPSTSGTVPESLPGFYSRWRPDSLDGQERPTEAQTVPARDIPGVQHLTQDTGFTSSTEEEETSGYESEGGRSLSPTTQKEPVPTVSPSTGRRPRTAFTAEQINSLEKAFKRNAYLGTQDKAELCKKLNLSDKQIRNWFQNRRMKLKRTVQDALAHACQAKVASHLMHYPEFQAFRPAPYPSYYITAQDTPTPYPSASSLHYNPSMSTQFVNFPVHTVGFKF